MKQVFNFAEKTMHDTRLTENNAEHLSQELTLGDDKRLASMARSHLQTARLFLQELVGTMAKRAEGAK